MESQETRRPDRRTRRADRGPDPPAGNSCRKGGRSPASEIKAGPGTAARVETNERRSLERSEARHREGLGRAAEIVQPGGLAFQDPPAQGITKGSQRKATTPKPTKPERMRY